MITLEAARQAVKDLLDDNLTDPENRSNTAWIIGFGADEYASSESFVGWPLVVVGHANKGKPEKQLGIGSVSRTAPLGNIILEVFAKGLGLEQLVDSIESVIETNESTLRTAGLHDITVTVGIGDVTPYPENPHTVPLVVEFRL